MRAEAEKQLIECESRLRETLAAARAPAPRLGAQRLRRAGRDQGYGPRRGTGPVRPLAEGGAMALMDKIFGEFVDVIEWTDDTQDTMVYLRAVRQRDQVRRHAHRAARLRRRCWSTKARSPTCSPPACTSCERPTCRSSRPCRTGSAAESPFKAEVYFFNTKHFTDLKWGTEPDHRARPEFGPVRLRAFGTYEIRIADPATFLREIVGTDGRFTTDEITMLRNLIVALCRRGRELGHSDPGPRRQLRAARPVRHRAHRARVRQLRPRAEQAPGRERLAAARGRAGARPAHLDGRGRRSRKYTQFQAAEAMRTRREPGRRCRRRGRHGHGHGDGQADRRGDCGRSRGRAATPPPLPQEGPSTSPATASRPDPFRSAS